MLIPASILCCLGNHIVVTYVVKLFKLDTAHSAADSAALHFK